MAAVRWTQRARDDLRDIHDFIARDSPRAAEALVERLLTATERLAAFPESSPRVVALCQNSLRLAIGKSSSAVTVCCIGSQIIQSGSQPSSTGGDS